MCGSIMPEKTSPAFPPGQRATAWKGPCAAMPDMTCNQAVLVDQERISYHHHMTVTAQRDVDAAAAAAQCVVRVHERLVDFLQPGLTLAEIDRYVAVALDDLDCTSAFLRYRIRGHPPFPSYACLSLNN